MNNNVDSPSSGDSTYDIVIDNGRVMDPLTRVDDVANVGIKNGKIAAIVPIEQRLAGDRVIDAAGLVVAPGFINIHGHGSGNGPGGEFHVRDGITTEITGNCGSSGGWSGRTDRDTEAEQQPTYPLADWFSTLEQQGLVINVASYIGHRTLREVVGITDVFSKVAEGRVAEMVQLVAPEIEAGALGISYGPFYAPGTTYEEMLALGKETSRRGGGSSSHIRSSSSAPVDIEPVTEAINLAREADIPFIVSHMGAPTLARKSTGAALEFIFHAREDGLRIATDCHPYDAFQTALAAATFEDPRDNYSNIEVATTVIIDGDIVMKAGESFSTPEQFHFIRDKVKAGEIPDPSVIGRIYAPHKTLLWLSSPITMVENDGAIRIDQATGGYGGHPRGAGSFARFLGYWVRQRGVCDLMTALSKTSSMAALWLGLDKKGRVQVGCDADLTLFDADKVVDKATYAEPGQPSSGIPHVIVNGEVAVDNGELTGALAGKVIRRTWEIPGILPELGRLPGRGIGILGE
jgi:N-acyl-D-amino-acid deacylase